MAICRVFFVRQLPAVRLDMPQIAVQVDLKSFGVDWRLKTLFEIIHAFKSKFLLTRKHVLIFHSSCVGIFHDLSASRRFMLTIILRVSFTKIQWFCMIETGQTTDDHYSMIWSSAFYIKQDISLCDLTCILHTSCLIIKYWEFSRNIRVLTHM